MKSWLYPISASAGATFRLENEELDATLPNFERLVGDGRLVQDEWWRISTNFRNVQPGDEVFIYTGDQNRGIIGYATVREVSRVKRVLRLKFDLKKCQALLDEKPLSAPVVRKQIPIPLRAAVVDLSPYMNGLRGQLPQTSGELVEQVFRRQARPLPRSMPAPKGIVGWREGLRSWMNHVGKIPPPARHSVISFFEQAFRHAREPSASWFGFHQRRASLVIGHYFLAAAEKGGAWILMDEIPPSASGFQVVPTGRSSLRWLHISELASIGGVAADEAVWKSYERASRLALKSPDGKPRGEAYYRKQGKERLCDIWPEPGRGNILREMESLEPTLKALSTTEREAVQLSRIGQGRFRDSLLGVWRRCAVTGCEERRVLRASHLKPWRDSTNAERLDPYNGLLLCPNLDAALDAGLISFDDKGKMLVSPQLTSEDAASLRIDPRMQLSSVQTRHLKYLECHRQRVFKH
jgi:hypothetical protein